MFKYGGIRKFFIEKLKDEILRHQIQNVTVKLGGNTSFDIYPAGWDKTYALKHFPETMWKHYFVGDRCGPDGNDFELFNYLNKSGTAWETSGPEETIEIIEIGLMRALEENNV
mgnify:CR=1 FL=1